MDTTHEKLKRLLWEEWDPIGIYHAPGAQDEYDMYAMEVWTMVVQRALAINFMHYNFCRKHLTIKTTPAMKAGLTDRLWTLHDLARLPDLMAGGAAA